MTYRSPRSKDRQSTLESELAGEFDATVIHNRVYERLGEDDELIQYCDALAAAEQSRDTRSRVHDFDQLAESMDDACEYFETASRERAREVTTEACATVLKDGSEWADGEHWDVRAVAEAQREAHEWLTNHTNVADRLGLLKEVSE